MSNNKTVLDNCPFCNIIKGTLQTPGIFWQDDSYMAFLSIDPNTKGFSCVIPKDHYGSDIMKMPDDKLKEFIITAKKVSKILEDYFDDVGRVGVIMEGTGVDHAHIKLIPMHGTKSLEDHWEQIPSKKRFWFDKYEGWICSAAGPEPNADELKALAKNLSKNFTQ